MYEYLCLYCVSKKKDNQLRDDARISKVIHAYRTLVDNLKSCCGKSN
jgi:hypothetical protein